MQSGAWRPTHIRRVIRSLPSSADTVLVLTDAGQGYLKAMGNRAGEHALACELVGTQLAKWFGLSTFDFALIDVIDVPEIPFAAGGCARPGKAFITRREKGDRWGGGGEQLKLVSNPDCISRLVVFDTWTLNWDRFPPDSVRKPNRDNVFLSEEAPPGRLLLKAMDHTECFRYGGDLTRKVGHVDRVQETQTYGLFPEFRRIVERSSSVGRECVRRLRRVTCGIVQRFVAQIPPEWDVNRVARDTLTSFIVDRADFLADRIMDMLWPQRELSFMGEEEGES